MKKKIQLENQMHGTELTLLVSAEPDELGRYQLSPGQLSRARRTLCPDPECRKLGCAADGAGQRGQWLYWLVDCNGKARPTDLPGDIWVELSCSVPGSSEKVSAGCYVGPYYKKGSGPTDSPAAGYLVWTRDRLIRRCLTFIGGMTQQTALAIATRRAKRQLEAKLERRAAALPDLEP